MHDIIEDTPTTYEDIEKEFGENVANIVRECSEDDRTLPWKERKDAVIKKIPSLSQEAAFIKSADILHNTNDLLNNFKIEGKEFFDNFNAPIDMKLAYEKKRLNLLKKYHPNPLLLDLEKKVSELSKLL